jgi:hypothetical protein
MFSSITAEDQAEGKTKKPRKSATVHRNYYRFMIWMSNIHTIAARQASQATTKDWTPDDTFGRSCQANHEQQDKPTVSEALEN